MWWFRRISEASTDARSVGHTQDPAPYTANFVKMPHCFITKVYFFWLVLWKSLTSSLESTYCFQTFLTLPGFQWSNLINIFQLGSSTPSNACSSLSAFPWGGLQREDRYLVLWCDGLCFALQRIPLWRASSRQGPGISENLYRRQF